MYFKHVDCVVFNYTNTFKDDLREFVSKRQVVAAKHRIKKKRNEDEPNYLEKIRNVEDELLLECTDNKVG